MIQRAVLWDVDGTLLRTGDLGADVMHRALADAIGRPPAERIPMSGKTDPEIVREYLVMMGVPGSEREAMTARVLGLVVELMGAAPMAEWGGALRGSADVLQAVAASPLAVSSVLSGLLQTSATLKLAAFGLDGWLDLDVGAYGSDDDDRRRLVPIALDRIEQRHGVRLRGDQVWIVGDTPRDLLCAQAAGARCLLVATGRFSADDLGRLGADAVVEDLRDTDAVVDLLIGDLSGPRGQPGSGPTDAAGRPAPVD